MRMAKTRCPICGRLVAYPQLGKHVSTHIVFNTCPICGRQFTKTHALIVHIINAHDRRYAVFALALSRNSKLRRRARGIIL